MNVHTGLTQEEIKQRIKNKQTNAVINRKLKSNWEIIITNTFNPFNLYNMVIAAALIYVGAFSSLMFMGVIVSNTLVFIIQEMRARKLIEKLQIIVSPKTWVLREGKEVLIKNEEIVLDDILILKAGNQISVDATILSGSLEVNESLLTGEVDAIEKNVNDQLFSGSYVVSGECHAIAKHVGIDSYAMKLTHHAVSERPVTSKLLYTFKRVTKITSLFVIPMGALLIYQGLIVRHQPLNSIVVNTASALLGMLPQGLVLLTTTSLVASMIKLGNKRALIQELYAIESLSQVDALCLDKTGTITYGKLSVIDTLALDDSFEDAIERYAKNNIDSNFTADALKEHFKNGHTESIRSMVPFSSERKWAALNFESNLNIIMGAPEVLAPNLKMPEKITQAIQNGSRIILLGSCELPIEKNQPLQPVKPLGFIILEDQIREDAKDAIAFFQDNGVAVKVISGDNPITVSKIAEKVGVIDANNTVDARTLHTEQELHDAILNHSVIGRATPAQKLEFVKLLQSEGNHVAMTGDGINDVLALKTANCAIAMGEGSDAALNVSQVIVTDGRLSTLVDVLKEGRNVIHNITRSASMFYLRTLMTFFITFAAIAMVIPFPFVPLQVTLTNIFASGLPSLLLLFEKNYSKPEIKISQHVLRYSLPSALAIIITWVLLNIFRGPLGLSLAHTQTISFFINGVMSMYLIFLIYSPMNRYRKIVYILNCIGFVGSIMIMRPLLQLTTLTYFEVALTVGFCSLAVFINTAIYNLILKISKQ
ncbi:MAG: HAD-IC family P-type ATPase [Erysipelothrix sp.]